MIARPMDDAPRDGSPILTWIAGEPVVIGWAQELEKLPPPFLQRPKNYQPELLRAGGWRRMIWCEAFGWGFHSSFDLVPAETWEALPPSLCGERPASPVGASGSEGDGPNG